eukprot:TRINITY_DN12253_c0_g2_i1.p1 TRINITY_DN12253_c0_g2~~TRINITY_DN12253_c0_g2_i1.p1  ORF type:complete len:342 (+),score=9.91 TRINITY_DN12253_c0_g2_i1:68-1027(+)
MKIKEITQIPNIQQSELNVKNMQLIMQGAHGELHTGVDFESNKKVVIKALSIYCGKSIEQQYMFSMREIILHTTLPQHPNIVPCYRIIQDEKRQMAYIVMPQMEGDLFQLSRGITSREQGPRSLMPESSIRQILQGVLLGLAHIHKQGFLHGDLKPENILYGKGGQIQICDFATSRHIGSVAHRNDIMGTVRFRPPEFLMESFRYYSASYDMWSIGCILGELILGQRLFPSPYNERKDFEFLTICQVLGTPSVQLFPCMAETDIFIPEFENQLNKLISMTNRVVSSECMQLLYSLLSYNPLQRPSATQALESPWFAMSD